MADTIPALFLSCVDRNGERTAFHFPEAGGWRSMTWRQAAHEVAGLARGLVALGVGPGVPVAIVSETRREWTAVDLATLSVGGITVGIYPSLLSEQVAFQLAHSGARVVVVEDAEQAAKVAEVRDRLPSLAHVVSIEPVDGLPSLADVQTAADLDWLREQSSRVRPEDTATFIYTSGTTGNPKGAVLTHANFVFVCEATRGVAAFERGDRAVIFLPLAHALQRYTLYFGLTQDLVGTYAASVDALPAALAHARPQVLATVPRMLEKVHARAQAAVAERGGVAQRLFDWAFDVGVRRVEHEERGERVPRRLQLQVRVAERLVFRKVRERLGGELRVLASGGAALDPRVARWFQAMGVHVLEGWGLTETAAPVTLNRQHDYRIGSVGKPIPGVELRRAGDGELLVRGPGIFQGYHADPDATAAVIRDGWFHTGDIGRIDDDGFVWITDRKKEMLVTASGKNVPPRNVEALVMRSPYVSQAVAVGDARPYVAALLVPDHEALAVLARQQGWRDEPLSVRIRRPEVQELFAAAVRDANATLARYEQIKRWEAIPAVFGVETGELTPTLKLKRRVVAERYADVIKRLYA